MSYNSCDFFYEHVAPKMVELFKTFDPADQGEAYDKFIKILTRSCVEARSEKFQSDLLRIAVDPKEELTIDQVVEKAFNMYVYDEMNLRKIEYAHRGAIINVDYEGVYREEGEA